MHQDSLIYSKYITRPCVSACVHAHSMYNIKHGKCTFYVPYQTWQIETMQKHRVDYCSIQNTWLEDTSLPVSVPTQSRNRSDISQFWIMTDELWKQFHIFCNTSYLNCGAKVILSPCYTILLHILLQRTCSLRKLRGKCMRMPEGGNLNFIMH